MSRHFDVHVVCGQPNRPEPNSSFLKAGAEVRNGVTIHRLGHRQFDKANPVGRMLNFVSFYQATRKHLDRSGLTADVVVSETDPFLTPIAGARFASRIGAKHCVYLQDIYPDVAVALGKARFPMVASTLRKRLRASYRAAAKVIVLGRCMKKRLLSDEWGIHKDKIEVIPNWADCSAITPVAPSENQFRREVGSGRKFLVMHSGNMGLTQRLDVLVRACAEPNWPTDAKLLLVGNGAARSKLSDLTKQLGLGEDRLQLVDYQPRKRLAESLSAADVHVVSMHERITGCLCPSKLYGIMAAGRPVIAIADSETDLSQTVSERGIGWCVEPGNPAEIANLIAEAEKEFRTNSESTEGGFKLKEQRSREAAVSDFDRPVIVKRFANLLSSMLDDQAGKTAPGDLGDLDHSGRFDESDSGIALNR